MNSAKTLLQFNFDVTSFASRAPRPPTIPKEQLETLEKIIKNCMMALILICQTEKICGKFTVNL